MENQDFEFVAITKNKKTDAVTEEATIEKDEETAVEQSEESAVKETEDLPEEEKADESPVDEDSNALTVAPVEELPPEKIEKEESPEDEIDDDDFIKKIKKEARKDGRKKFINLVCTGLIVLLLAIPVLLLIYIIITFIK